MARTTKPPAKAEDTEPKVPAAPVPEEPEAEKVEASVSAPAEEPEAEGVEEAEEAEVVVPAAAEVEVPKLTLDQYAVFRRLTPFQRARLAAAVGKYARPFELWEEARQSALGG